MKRWLESSLETINGFLLLVLLPAGLVVAALDLLDVIDLPG